MNAVFTTICAVFVLAGMPGVGSATTVSDELIVTQTGPSALLQGLPVDITVPEIFTEPSASARIGSVPPGTQDFDFSVFLLEPGTGGLSDIVLVSGGSSSGGISVSLFSDTDGLALDPIGHPVGGLPETGSFLDLTGFFAGPLAQVLGAPLPIDISVSSDADMPEPATPALFGVGLLGLFAAAWRRNAGMPRG